MNIAIIVAAGKGKRFGKKNKLLVDLAGKPVFLHTVEAFRKS
ncbi:MAG TPA: 2-C-methyl-D-erythritol 4-phosphate cytidylyltransferase, partial [Candidatus Peregrinibacteria bacterium]|nr:2-C-methyl-D-erythritol 4-phosphate cytidylyltransferase [Candidatus Peregrinibacteria bacterium]